MPELATVTRVLQIGPETTPGTSVAANKRIRSFSIDATINASPEVIRGIGGKFPIASSLGKEWVEADLNGYLTYTEIIYLLNSVLKNVTPTQISPPSGTAYRWTFTPSQTSEDSIKTYTIERGSSTRAHKFSYGIVTGFSLSIDREKAEIGGTMLGKNFQDGITLTASPTDIDVVPVIPSTVDVFMDTTSAGLGTTRLSRVLSLEFEINDRFGSVWTLDSTQVGYAAHVEMAFDAKLTLTLEADASGMGPLSAVRNGDKRFIRIKSIGPNIETGNDYMFQLDMCGLVSEVGDFSDEDGVYAIQWVFAATHDPGWSKALEIQIINKLNAL